MDVNDFWPTDKEMNVLLSDGQRQAWRVMFAHRQITWNGFAEIEAEKGVVRPKVSLSTSYGQEVLRIIMFRVLEEASEALMAEDKTHVQEELIDSMNYLMSMFLLDHINLSKLLDDFSEMTKTVDWDSGFSTYELGLCTKLLGGVLSDKLRNRAWMNQAQDFYFSGGDLLTSTLLEVAKHLMSSFNSFHDFMRMYIAKDRVLQFRLKSKY